MKKRELLELIKNTPPPIAEMHRTDLSVEEWIQHAIEEMLDGAQYLYRIKQELAKRLDK